MKVLLVCPENPDTFWSFKHVLRFAPEKAAQPPLGLLTVASLLPAEWVVKLVDLNVNPLCTGELQWADYVFLGGMTAQAESARAVIARCNDVGTKIVAGGPLFTALHGEFAGVDHFVLNEAEITLPCFLEDLQHGRPGHLYSTDKWADVTATPLPRWNLIDPRQYLSMNLQYSRGCPYDCEFCDITVLYGRRPRTKSGAQVLSELDALYRTGWRGHVLFVDDNFIGNNISLKKEILPSIIQWMEARRYPFSLGTQASVNLADDSELLTLMARAGFEEVFIGIETLNAESLDECGKVTNKNRDLRASVRTLQEAGLQVQGGFIVGFDHDPPSIFDDLIHFIMESRIVIAMVGLLNAPINSRLYCRLKDENRLLNTFFWNNTDFSMNFIPKMNRQALLDGYRKVLSTIYSPKEYYRRVTDFLKTYEAPQQRKFTFRFATLHTLAKTMLLLGVVGEERLYYWKLFFWSLFFRPRLFTKAILLAVHGFHFRQVFEGHR